MTQNEIHLIEDLSQRLGIYIDWQVDFEKMPLVILLTIAERFLKLESIVRESKV